MKTKVLIILILLSFIHRTSAQDVYLNMIDSLLKTMSKLILNDLSANGIKLSERPWIGFGDSFELDVVFDTKRSETLTSLSRPDSLKQVHKKRKLTSYIKRTMFLDYVYDHSELPYDQFDYLNYTFLQAQIGEENFGAAIFGIYKFEATKEGLTIIDRNIEILNSKEAIMDKYNSDWQ